MPAIDFGDLMRAEKRKSRPKVKKPLPTKVPDGGNENHDSRHDNLSKVTLPSWPINHPQSILCQEHQELPPLEKVCSDPPNVYYSRFDLDPTSLTDWLQHIPSGDSGLEVWKTMTYGKRRVCMFGEQEATPILPPPLSIIAAELVQNGVFPATQPPNHVLLNEYQPSQGILPHTDGPQYASRTATLSLGSDVVIEFSRRLATDEIGRDFSSSDIGNGAKASSPFQVLLHANSLIVFEEEAYIGYCHGISMGDFQDVTNETCINADSGITVQRGLRYSLTFRHKLDSSVSNHKST
eukprot:Nitzschia sp. Nitz4//scaffold105_size73764//54616//55497//NITZ4_005682-RA/size73764-processed-gene-0.23-mRNA-1//-1//CDS//3329532465//9201//frame0